MLTSAYFVHPLQPFVRKPSSCCRHYYSVGCTMHAPCVWVNMCIWDKTVLHACVCLWPAGRPLWRRPLWRGLVRGERWPVPVVRGGCQEADKVHGGRHTRQELPLVVSRNPAAHTHGELQTAAQWGWGFSCCPSWLERIIVWRGGFRASFSKFPQILVVSVLKMFLIFFCRRQKSNFHRDT